MTEAEAYTAFLKARWPETGGKPVCPRCGSTRAYIGKNRRRLFHCANPQCRAQFSATSGTAFASRKMTYARLLYVMERAGKCASLEIQRQLGCQYKTAYVAAQKVVSGSPERWIGYWQKPREIQS